MILDVLAIVMFVVAVLFALLALVRVNINLGYIQHRQPGFVKWSGVLSASAVAAFFGVVGWFLLSA